MSGLSTLSGRLRQNAWQQKCWLGICIDVNLSNPINATIADGLGIGTIVENG
jgi:hypothetical protein